MMMKFVKRENCSNHVVWFLSIISGKQRDRDIYVESQPHQPSFLNFVVLMGTNVH